MMIHSLTFNVVYHGDSLPHEVCQMAEMLLAAGASPNAQGKDGCTPMHCATQNDFEDLYALLAKRGACITIPWKKRGSEDTASTSSTSRDNEVGRTDGAGNGPSLLTFTR